MQSDEQIYELVAKELATAPRQGLLIKCMAKCEGSEGKGKAMYIETRVDEIKREIKHRAKEEAEKVKEEAKKEERKNAKSTKEELSTWFIGMIVIFILIFLISFIRNL